MLSLRIHVAPGASTSRALLSSLCSATRTHIRHASTLSRVRGMNPSTSGMMRRGVGLRGVAPVGHTSVVVVAAIRSVNDDHGVPGALPMHEDLYARLGLNRNTDRKSVKEHFHKLAKHYHPDRHGGDKDATEKFKRIKEAYEILKDDSKRKTYDATGSSQQAGNSGRWEYGQYHYTYNAARYNPMRFYLGLAATTWLLVLLVRWSYEGSFTGNFMTLLTMLAVLSFFGRIVATAILWYLYAPSQQAKDRNRRGVADSSTVVMTVHVAPQPQTRPTRVLRLTGVNRDTLPKRNVEFKIKWPGMADPSQPLVLTSRQGESYIQLPNEVPEAGLFVTARLLEDGYTVTETVVDLS